METVADHKTLIDRLGGNAVVARRGEWLAVTVGQWKVQNRIPPEQWPKIIEMAGEDGLEGIDSDWLMRNWAARKNAAGTDQPLEVQANAA